MIGKEFSYGVTQAEQIGSWLTCGSVNGKLFLEKSFLYMDLKFF